MIPISDHLPARRWPAVNYAIIAINILAFLYELSLGARLDRFILTWGVVPREVAAYVLRLPGAPADTPLTVVTAMFLHGGFLHIAGNMLFLWIFGDNVEDAMGHFRYFVFYLFCGLAATAAQVVVDPLSRVPLIGASGAIAGVLGAYVFLHPLSRVSVLVPIFLFFTVLEVPAFLMLGIWIVSQLASGFAAITSVRHAAAGGVGWWAHIGGFVAGIVLIPLFRRRSLVRRW